MDAEKYIQERLELIRRNSTYGLICRKDTESEEERMTREELKGHCKNKLKTVKCGRNIKESNG